MSGQASADEVSLVILFFLTCAVLIACLTESMLQAIEEKRAEIIDDEYPWEEYFYGPGPHR